VYISPSLRPLARLLIARLPGCAHPWGRALGWVLRTRAILAFPLPGRTAGFTNPLLPLILIDRRLARRLPAPGRPGEQPAVQLDDAGRIADPLACAAAQLLLHEAAHQLWAVWPEWRRWFGLKHVYGPSINAADAVAEAISRELCAHTKYRGMDITYRSPMSFLSPRFRR
jgi:hypothetical protein